VIKTYVNRKPEEVAAALAAEFGFKVGALEATGISLTRNFLTATSVADIIISMYTLASRETGKQYHFGFRGDELFVSEKKVDELTLILSGESNLIAANTTESIENMVNAVQIYDKDGRFVREVADQEAIDSYGRLQEALKQTKDDNMAAEAQKLLDQGGAEQKISVDCLGNIANVAGGAVVVHEPYTGLYGLFYIDSDVHEWRNGLYFNKLVLNYKSIMSEKEAGSLPNATGAKTSDKQKEKPKYVYVGGGNQ
jgi:hypothetical protein